VTLNLINRFNTYNAFDKLGSYPSLHTDLNTFKLPNRIIIIKNYDIMKNMSHSLYNFKSFRLVRYQSGHHRNCEPES